MGALSRRGRKKNRSDPPCSSLSSIQCSMHKVGLRALGSSTPSTKPLRRISPSLSIHLLSGAHSRLTPIRFLSNTFCYKCYSFQRTHLMLRPLLYKTAFFGRRNMVTNIKLLAGERSVEELSYTSSLNFFYSSLYRSSSFQSLLLSICTVFILSPSEHESRRT